jgi:hypothetical protein
MSVNDLSQLQEQMAELEKELELIGEMDSIDHPTALKDLFTIMERTEQTLDVVDKKADNLNLKIESILSEIDTFHKTADEVV